MSHATLTPSVVKHLMRMPEMAEQFPFMRFATKALQQKEKRSCCGRSRRSGPSNAKVLDTVMASIAHLPPERISIIKKALRVDRLTIHVNVNGKMLTHNR